MMSIPANLSFQDTRLDVVDRNGKPWLRGSQIGTALGYNREDDVTQIYRRNKDEFDEFMTAVVDMSSKRQIDVLIDVGTTHSVPQDEVLSKTVSKGRARIFSLRGAHLIAMLARTPKAKEFRKWILDLLGDMENGVHRASYKEGFKDGFDMACQRLATPKRYYRAQQSRLLVKEGTTRKGASQMLGCCPSTVSRDIKLFDDTPSSRLNFEPTMVQGRLI